MTPGEYFGAIALIFSAISWVFLIWAWQNDEIR